MATDATLSFLGYELFPPDKQNLIIARFGASPALRAVQVAAVSAAASVGMAEIAEKHREPWLPHVTLGKIGATRDQIGQIRLSLPMPFEANAGAAGLVHPMGLCLVGEAPRQVTLDWCGLQFSLGTQDHSRLAREALRERNPDLALHHSLAVLEADSDDASAHAVAGAALANLGRRDDAIVHLRAALAASGRAGNALEDAPRKKCGNLLQRLEQEVSLDGKSAPSGADQG